MILLDIIFPKRCIHCRTRGSYICAQCFSYITFCETMVCTECQKQAMGGLTHPVCRTQYSIDGVFPSLVYKGIVKKMIYTFKYPPYLTDMKQLLGELLYEGIIQNERLNPLLQQQSIIVPIPISAQKYRKRGYNHATILASLLGQKLASPVHEYLRRIKDTPSQVGLGKEEREKNIKAAFRATEQAKQSLREFPHIFLVDDVVTSGATLKEAAKVLKKAGAKHVWGITLAHGE